MVQASVSPASAERQLTRRKLVDACTKQTRLGRLFLSTATVDPMCRARISRPIRAASLILSLRVMLKMVRLKAFSSSRSAPKLPCRGGLSPFRRRAMFISSVHAKARSICLAPDFLPLRKGQVIDLARRAPSQSQPSLADFSGRNGATAAVRVLNRARVIETALQFASVRWRVNAGAYGPDPDRVCSGFNRIRRPGYLQGMRNQDVVGIPYCWGVMDRCRGLPPP